MSVTPRTRFTLHLSLIHPTLFKIAHEPSLIINGPRISKSISRVRFLGEFHFHFSRLWIWPGNVNGMGLSLFFLFEKLDGPRFRNILRLRLRSIWAQSSLSLFRDLSTRRMLLNRSCARRWNDTYVLRDVFILSYRGIIPSRENDSRMIGVKERS